MTNWKPDTRLNLKCTRETLCHEHSHENENCNPPVLTLNAGELRTLEKLEEASVQPCHIPAASARPHCYDKSQRG